MSKLDDLIEKLCPNGVLFMQIKEIGQVRMCKRILKSETNIIGGVPFYKIGTFGKEANAFISEETFYKYKQQYSYPKKGDILISCSGTIGRTVVFDGEPAYFQDSNIVWLEHDGTKILNEYLKYIYNTQPWRISTGGTIARLYNDNILNTKIPVPPLEVQNEIVHILDNYTKLSLELKSKLSEELKARRKQYEYYKEEIWKNTKDIYIEKLSELCDIGDGLHGTPNYSEGTKLWFINGNNLDNRVIVINQNTKEVSQDSYNKYLINLKKGSILLSINGTIGKTAYYNEEKVILGKSVAYFNILDESKVLKEYLYFYLQSKEAMNYYEYSKTGSTIKNLGLKALRDMKIPLPSIDKQMEIANIISRFEKLCNDISECLPAEIEAIQKQYEYYRDKLLTFKELKINE